jgi:putative ABC transport system permease protein
MATLLLDLRLAIRRLRLAPGFTLFAVASLALGIGVSTAIYSAVRTLLWTPLGIPRSDQLISVKNAQTTAAMSWPDFRDVRAMQTTAHAIAASVPIRTAASAGSFSHAVFGEAVSGEFFNVMELTPARGRLLNPRDETDAARVVVLSESFWRRHLNADPEVAGQPMMLGGQPYVIVGVIAGSFHGLETVASQAIWIPITSLRADPRAFSIDPGALEQRSGPVFNVWARAKSGITASRVGAEATTIGRQLDEAYPTGANRMPREWSAQAGRPGESAASDAIGTIVTMIFTALIVVLLIACTNLANLSLARGTARSLETAVRSALGASRWRLVREQLIETALVVSAGGALAWLVLLRLVAYLSTDLPMGRGIVIPFRPEIDGTVLAASAGATVLALIVFGVWPAVQSTRADVRQGLGAGAAATPPRWRLHRNLIAWQVCGSVALLLVAIMSARVVTDKTGLPGNTRYRDLALVNIDFALNGIPEARARVLTAAVVDALRTERGVASGGAINGSPGGLSGLPQLATTPQVPFNAQHSNGKLTDVAGIGPGLFETLKLRIVRGRPLSSADDAGGAPVGVASEQLARDLYGTTDVLGRSVMISSLVRIKGRPASIDAITIVGVSADVRSWPGSRGDSVLFVPLAQRYDPRAPVSIVARSDDPSAAVGVLRAVVRRVDPNLALSAAGMATVLLEGPRFILRAVGTLAAALGTLALVLAMAGLFGVLSHVVERRTREIGIRLAIGAERAQIVQLVLRDGMRPVMKGLVLGLVIGLGSRILIRGEVFATIGAWDPVEFTMLPLLFLCAALIACWLPAARASRVNPNVALRDL